LENVPAIRLAVPWPITRRSWEFVADEVAVPLVVILVDRRGAEEALEPVHSHDRDAVSSWCGHSTTERFDAATPLRHAAVTSCPRHHGNV
jgi:hypothetical protein